MGAQEGAPGRGKKEERPRLGVAWSSLRESLEQGLHALFELPPLKLDAVGAATAFRDAHVRGITPSQAWLLSGLLHVLFLVVPLPAFLTRPPARNPSLQAVRIEYDLKWVGNSRVLPPISPTPRRRPQPAPGGQENQPLPPPGADTPAPQTIVSNPPEPNHPTQTVIRQLGLENARVRAPEVRLPNMVIPSVPNPPVATSLDLTRMRVPGAPVDSSGPPQAPLAPPPKSRAELALEGAKLVNVVPWLTLPTSAAEEGAGTAPEVNVAAGVARSGDVPVPGVVALSADPVAPAPVIKLPDTNLRAKFVSGPYTGAGSPGGVTGGVPGASGGSGGGPGGEGGGPGGLVVPDVLVTAAGPVPAGPVIVGAGRGAGGATPPAPPPQRSAAREQASSAQAPPRSPKERAKELLEGLSPGSRPGAGPRYRRVYTIYINMPNLTSQSGSWVLRFAELDSGRSAAPGGASDNYPLAAPVPMKKVDPTYPSDARRTGIEGTVSLYGIIRADGSVEDIQVVRGLHEQLNQSAVAAFRRWRFHPGEKNGSAVDLEVVVEIPFRLSKLF